MTTKRPIVAVVDDEDAVRRAMQRLLSSYGLQVHVYASGQEFLDALSQIAFGCVILDLHMPVMSGFEVQERIALMNHSLPVIAITGHDAPDVAAKARSLGAFAYLRKPVIGARIVEAINNATGSDAGS